MNGLRLLTWGRGVTFRLGVLGEDTSCGVLTVVPARVTMVRGKAVAVRMEQGVGVRIFVLEELARLRNEERWMHGWVGGWVSE